MPLHPTESGGLAVAPSPMRSPGSPPKLSPLAGLIVSPTAPITPFDAPESPTQFLAPRQPTAPQTEPAAEAKSSRTTVYSPEKRQVSPWSTPSANLSARELVRPVEDRGTPQSLPAVDSGIEGIRDLLFGSALQEIRTKVAELQLSLNGEMKRMRDSVMERMDEMAASLHRDMIVLREETQSQVAQLKTDVFTAATAISGTRDHLAGVELKAREALGQSVADIYGRMAQQETQMVSMLDHLQEKVGKEIESTLAASLTEMAKKSDVANLLNQVSLMVANSEPATTDPLSKPLFSQQHTETKDPLMDAMDWFRIPDPTVPDPHHEVR